MADEEHSRSASSYDGDDDFVEAEDNGEDFEGFFFQLILI